MVLWRHKNLAFSEMADAFRFNGNKTFGHKTCDQALFSFRSVKHSGGTTNIREYEIEYESLIAGYHYPGSLN